MRLQLLSIIFALTLCSCASIDATPTEVKILTLGQVAVSVGCPTASQHVISGSDAIISNAGAAVDKQGSPCVSVVGGRVSDALANIMSALAGYMAAAWMHIPFVH